MKQGILSFFVLTMIVQSHCAQILFQGNFQQTGVLATEPGGRNKPGFVKVTVRN